MKFTAEITFAPRSDPALLAAGPLATVVRAAEAGGFDAVAFNEHPVPSVKWLDAGGHDAFDPLVALGCCVPWCERLRLLTYLVVLPYRNPFVTAKAVASLDVLSGGRTIVGVGTGYLRSEFAAVGAEFDERNALFDEAVDAMLGVWGEEPVGLEGSHFTALAQVATPRPVQQPHPPLWIGGNSGTARRRVARYGQGWAPLQTDEVAARTTRTAPLVTHADLRAAIDDLRRLVEAEGRDPGAVEIQLQALESNVGPGQPVDAESHLDTLGRLGAMGVTQFVVHLVLGADAAAHETVERYATEIIARAET